MNEAIRQGIINLAKKIGADPIDLATVMSFETGGTFNPKQPGPVTKWGQHRGLIQFGEPQARKYGIDWNNLQSQFDATGKYLQDAGFKPGMGLMDLYSAVNAGKVGRYKASDTKAGGTPGTVEDKVNNQMGDDRQNALAMLMSYFKGGQGGGAPAAPPQGGFATGAFPGRPAPGLPGYTPTGFDSNALVPSGGGGGVAPSQQPFSLQDYLMNKGQPGGTSRAGNALTGLGGAMGGGAGGGPPQPPQGYQASVAANKYQPSPMPGMGGGQQMDPMMILKQLGLI